MPSKPKGLPPSGPQKKIEWEYVDEMLMKGCNGVQIASSLGVHVDTLYNRCESEKGTLFSLYSQQKREKGDALLHATQFNVAMKEDKTMLIWLGKQRLGQKENPGQVIPEEISTAFAEVMRLWADKQLAAKEDQDALNSEEINIISDK